MTARERVGEAARAWLGAASGWAQRCLLQMADVERERLWDAMAAAVLAHAADLRGRIVDRVDEGEWFMREAHASEAVAAVLAVPLDPPA